MKPNPIALEISGPTAMWTRPYTGSSPVSYVAPTFSAVKGIFESVLRWKSVNIQPIKVEICAPVQFHRYTTTCLGWKEFTPDYVGLFRRRHPSAKPIFTGISANS